MKVTFNNLQEVMDNLTFEDLDYLLPNRITTLNDDGTLNREFVEYINNKEEK